MILRMDLSIVVVVAVVVVTEVLVVVEVVVKVVVMEVVVALVLVDTHYWSGMVVVVAMVLGNGRYSHL